MTDALVASAARVVGLYHEDVLVGFTRTVSDGHVHSYLADVFVLAEHRGRGLGVELVRFTVDDGPFADTVAPPHRRRARPLREVGFGAAGERLMERAARRPRLRSGFGDFHVQRASRSSRCSRARASEIRSCVSESRSRIVIVSSSSVCSSIVNANGVPISSWRR